jgi:hypothetical protein
MKVEEINVDVARQLQYLSHMDSGIINECLGFFL